MSSFAERARELRLQRKWSQPEVAKYFTDYMKKHKNPDDTKKHRYSPQHISDWETGTIPRGDTLAHLATFYKVSVPYILGITDNPKTDADAIDMQPQEKLLIDKLRANPEEASFVYRSYGIEPPTRALAAGKLALPEQTDN